MSDATEVVVRPPQAPVRLAGAIAVLTAPLAVVAIVLGDPVLGLIGLASAVWAGAIAYLASTARSRADATGVTVRWMRAEVALPWDEVAEVHVDRAGPGGPRRGAILFRHDGTTLRWTPWIPLLWFAQPRAVQSLVELDDLLVARGGGLRVLDPGAPDDDTPTWTRRRPEKRLPRSADEAAEN